MLRAELCLYFVWCMMKACVDLAVAHTVCPPPLLYTSRSVGRGVAGEVCASPTFGGGWEKICSHSFQIWKKLGINSIQLGLRNFWISPIMPDDDGPDISICYCCSIRS